MASLAQIERELIPQQEPAGTEFLRDLDWKSVAGASESDEEKTATFKLETVLTDLDRTARRLAANERELEDPDHPARRKLLTDVANDEARVSTLEAERNALQLTLEAARARADALYTSESLTELIGAGTPEANDVRLRLRAEIRKRISRIEFTFGATFAGNTGLRGSGWTVVRIRFVNGAERLIVLKGEGYILLWMK